MGSVTPKQNSKEAIIKQQIPGEINDKQQLQGTSNDKQQLQGTSNDKQQLQWTSNDKQHVHDDDSKSKTQGDDPVERLREGLNQTEDQSKHNDDQGYKQELNSSEADEVERKQMKDIDKETEQRDLKPPSSPREGHQPLDKDCDQKSDDKLRNTTHQLKLPNDDTASEDKGLRESFDHSNNEKKVDNGDKSDGDLIRGLPNIESSSCYLSSLIQVLAQTPSFIDKLLSNNQNNHVANTLIKLFVEINDAKYGRGHTDGDLYNLVVDLQKSMSERDECYQSGIQNDCHSLYLCLMNVLDEEIKGSTSLFDGHARSIFRYSTCDHVEESPPECIRSLLLTVGDNQPSVEDSLERLDAMVTFDDAEVPCRICLDKNLHHKDTQTYKQCLIKSPPEILVLQLARFKQDGYGKLYKYEESVHYPSNLSLRVSRQGLYDRQCVDYDLYGVICHEGNLEGGHYWCYVKKNGWNLDNHYLWHLCADSYVRRLEVNEEWPCSPFAYLLFYKKSKSSQDV